MDERQRTTTINVKGVWAELWEQAGVDARRQDQKMGEWLNDVLAKALAQREGPREFGPSEPDRPRREMSPEQVAALLQGVGATQGQRHPAAVDLRSLAGEMAREALGLDPRPVRSAANRSANPPLQIGQAALIEQSAPA